MSTVQTPLMQEVVQASCNHFALSRTYAALCASGRGEENTRRLYLQLAHRMEQAGLYVIAHAFRFTAAQEKEHAAIFRGLITSSGGQYIPGTEDAPLPLPREPLDVLKAVAQSEHDEWDTLYPGHARLAAEEGYPRIASAFRRIAETEQAHALRFLQYAKALADGTLFRDDRRVSWLCLPCGQLHTGFEPPSQCSSCGHDRGHFIRSSYHPFLVEN